METTINSCNPSTKKTLDQLVSLLAAGSLPAAVHRKSFIVNDVPRALPISADENMLATVLSSILQIVISHTENSCIRIAANINDKIVNVQMQDNNFNGNVIESDLKQVQTIANKMGGYLSIHTNLKKITSIAFSFPNIPQAA
jgi:hypothetical protein